MLFIIAGLPGTSISADETAGKDKQQKNPYTDAEITIKTIPAANNTFGYDILLYGKPLVHQPAIPGLPGNEGFTTKESAKTVAEFLVKKIRNNEMPPTVTNLTSELCELEGETLAAWLTEGATQAPVIADLNNMGVLK